MTEIQRPMGERRFGAVNWLGAYTMILREIRRFTNVWTQTLIAPVVTAGLFMTVFSLAFAARRGDVDGIPFTQFLAPGILMMTIIQNAFANTSSSLVISKIQGNIVDTLMPPLSPTEILTGYVLGGMARGMCVAVLVGIVIFPFAGIGVAHLHWAVAFALLGSAMLSLIGIIAGVFSNKFDQMAAITNFIVTPLSFLSGTFYSISGLPDWMQTLSHLNPVFYLIDGFRYGVLGQSDSAPTLGIAVTGGVVVVLWLIAHWFFRTGYRIKS